MKCYQIEHRSKEESYGMAKTGADSGLENGVLALDRGETI